MNKDMIFKGLQGAVGNTPLLAISYTYKGRPGRVYAKAEYFNLSGSIKDRVAMHILKKAYESGEIRQGDLISEATSGNTGISFSAIGSALGHKVVIYMPDWMTRERIQIMKSFGAEVRLVSREEGGFLGSIQKTEELAAGGGVYLPRQFSNEENSNAHYLTTGLEIVRQMESLGLKADGIVAGVGTGGTVMGIGRRLREANPACRVYPLEPMNSPTLSTGKKCGTHRIFGISDEFIPDLCKLDTLDGIISVDDGDAIAMARLLASTFGIGVGVSSGANFLGAVKAGLYQGQNANIVTVFADDNKKYLSTDYAADVEYKDFYMTKDIVLTDIMAIR